MIMHRSTKFLAAAIEDSILITCIGVTLEIEGRKRKSFGIPDPKMFLAFGWPQSSRRRPCNHFLPPPQTLLKSVTQRPHMTHLMINDKCQ
jgi:hypothetical protein